MDRYFGVIGIIFILGLSYLMSNNKKAISVKTVVNGLLLQILLAVFVLKVPLGQMIFAKIGLFIQHILAFSMQGADFVFGVLTCNPDRMCQVFQSDAGIFALKLIPANIFVMILVNILYYYGVMQKLIAFLGKAMNKIMQVSGAEALSNVASSFVGQILAQITIKPYLEGMTRSEILASMTGSMACIAGAVMAIYISIGIPAEYLLAASIMAAPGALVISKIVYPETEESETKNSIKIETEKTHVNVLDAISQGASDGMDIAIKIVAMLIALIALISMIDWILAGFGTLLHNIFHLSSIGVDLTHLSLKLILGKIFSVFAFLMGVSLDQASTVGALLGTKLAFNETLAYFDLVKITGLSHKSYVIAVFALCGFANITSIAIQIGGIGTMAPSRRKDLAELGFRALICGTFASYISACIAGILCG
ncbi:MAG: nucleoside transporter C-terminal domain-containing protein [Candidatus Gastranaerophilales bacterium]|nr:nucleoside transporter C-terminal domain-containing protein [Candidatus Gastranaerophilales bacterium]